MPVIKFLEKLEYATADRTEWADSTPTDASAWAMARARRLALSKV